MQLSIDDLNENIHRFNLTIEELKYCLENLNEEKDELLSTNGMMKGTIQALLPPVKQKLGRLLRPIQRFWNTPGKSMRRENNLVGVGKTPDRTKLNPSKSQIFQKAKSEEVKEENTVSQTISEDIEMPKIVKSVRSMPRSEILNLPRGKLGKVKRHQSDLAN